MLRKAEADFITGTFRKWLLGQPNFYTAAFEVKRTERDYLPFSDVKPHQLAALKAASGAGFLYKIPDGDSGRKPFDLFFMRNDEAYVVVKYPKMFCLIPVDRFEEESRSSKRRSLLSADAKKLSTVTVALKSHVR